MNKIDFVNNSEPDIDAEHLNQLQENVDNAKVEKVSGKDLSTNDFTNDYKNKIDNYLIFQITGQAGNALYWRIAQLNRYFGSLVTLNIFCDNGYVMTVHLNIGYISGKGIVLEKIGTPSVYSNKPFTKARLVYKEDTVYLELFTPQQLSIMRCYVTVHTFKNYMCTFTQMNEVGSVPEGYSTKEIEI